MWVSFKWFFYPEQTCVTFIMFFISFHKSSHPISHMLVEVNHIVYQIIMAAFRKRLLQSVVPHFCQGHDPVVHLLPPAGR